MGLQIQITDEILEQMEAELTKPGAPFALTTETIRGVDYKVFQDVSKNLRELYATGMEKDSFIARVITKWFGERDWPFIVYQDEVYTFAESYHRAARLSWRLKERYSVKKGDRVAIAMRNYPEFCFAFMAVTGMGAIAVPLNAWWEGPELQYGIYDSEPKLIFTDQERADRLKPYLGKVELPLIIARPTAPLMEGAQEFNKLLAGSQETEFPSEDVQPDDDAYIIYTSGSTGNPKGVVTTHRAIINTLRAWEYGQQGFMYLNQDLLHEMKPEYKSACLLTVPLFHVTGLVSIFLGSFRAKRKMVMMYKWNPEEALRLIEKERITHFNGVPTMSWELVNSPEFDKYDTSSLAFLGGGGAARPPEHVKHLERKMNRHISQAGYGLTETTALGATNSGENYANKPDSVGRPTPPIVEVKIVDVDGKTLKSGEIGEICFKSCANFRGYWKKPEATKEALLDGGWFRTGDLGCVDEEGFIYIKDRAKDLVIRGGENISCKEVEDVIYEHPAVFEAAVFGVPDERLGEQLAAVIMIKPGEELDEDHLRDFLSERMARFKVPNYIWLQDEPLPRMGTGKIFKRKMKEEKIEMLRREGVI
ncbi:MAG: acyl--CoA ligase [Deltaproteobacteria bacterium]|nr:acyl--CoA ligase [Deltaproteobacteria bacterium]